MMKEFLFDERSKSGRFVFGKLLEGMDSPFRNRFNDPEKLIKASGLLPGQTVLEVGCGSGFFTPTISEIVGKTGQVESIDLHPMAVETVNRKMLTLGRKNVRVSQADAHQTVYPEESFDTIIVYGVVPAPVIDEKKLGSEMYRLLKPGGTLAVWTIVPFWSPKTIIKETSFTRCSKHQGIYRLQKPDFTKNN